MSGNGGRSEYLVPNNDLNILTPFVLALRANYLYTAVFD